MEPHRSISVDNLRGVAVLLVVIYHFFVILGIGYSRYFITWGGLGVDIFFIISGFLIFNSYEKGYETFGFKKGLKVYFINRFFRIVPAYYFNLVIILLIVPFFITDYSFLFSLNFLKQVIGHLGFLAYIIYRDNGWGLNGAYWTLSIEVLWYLIVPIIFFYGSSYRRLLFLISLSFLYVISLEIGLMNSLLAISMPDRIFNVSIELMKWWFYHQLPGQFLFFGIGILLCKMHKEHKLGYLEKYIYAKLHYLPIRYIFYLVSLLLVFIVGGLQLNSFILRTFVMAFVSSAIFIFLFFAKQREHGVFSWIGKISYSIYLWHFPLLAIGKKINILHHVSLFSCGLIFASMLLTISSLSYYFIEERGFAMRNKAKIRFLSHAE